MSDLHGLANLHIAQFWKSDIFPGNADVPALVYCPVGLMVVVFASEYRVGCTFLEIIHKTSVQIAQGLLQGNGVHHFQKGKVITLFHHCQHRRSLGIAGLAAIF